MLGTYCDHSALHKLLSLFVSSLAGLQRYPRRIIAVILRELGAAHLAAFSNATARASSCMLLMRIHKGRQTKEKLSRQRQILQLRNAVQWNGHYGGSRSLSLDNFEYV
jgi:hypothetical protein